VGRYAASACQDLMYTPLTTRRNGLKVSLLHGSCFQNAIPPACCPTSTVPTLAIARKS
jgi:hypothetical protein